MNTRFRNFLIIFCFILLIISIGFSNGGRTSTTIVENITAKVFIPIQKNILAFSNNISSKVESFSNIFVYKTENEQLKKENKRLKNKLKDAKLSEYELKRLDKLKESLNYIDNRKSNEILTSNIIAKNNGNWFKTFLINAGKNQGIKKYSVVISENGLIGKIYELGDEYSKVITIVDSKSKISFENLTDNLDDKYQGVIETSQNGVLNAKVYKSNPNVEKGDEIITSGLGIYPKGITIGKVVEITKNDGFLLELKIKPIIDFENLDKVMIYTIDRKKSEWLDEK
ncbi:MAG: rod shape-determining protein MreC [Bacillota bacterium]